MEINYSRDKKGKIRLRDIGVGRKFKFADTDATWIRTNHVENGDILICDIGSGVVFYKYSELEVIPIDEPRESSDSVKLSDLEAGETFVFGEYDPSNRYVYVKSSYLLLTRQVMTLRLSDGTRQDFDSDRIVTKVNCKVEVSRSEN